MEDLSVMAAASGLLANDETGTDGAGPNGLNPQLSSSRAREATSTEEFEYKPHSGFVGNDTFQYQIVDADGDTDDAEVLLMILDHDRDGDGISIWRKSPGNRSLEVGFRRRWNGGWR